MRPYDPVAHALSINRRSFLTKSAYGLGSAAFAMLAAKSGFADLHAAQFSKGVLKAPHLPVKARAASRESTAAGRLRSATIERALPRDSSPA